MVVCQKLSKEAHCAILDTTRFISWQSLSSWGLWLQELHAIPTPLSLSNLSFLQLSLGWGLRNQLGFAVGKDSGGRQFSGAPWRMDLWQWRLRVLEEEFCYEGWDTNIPSRNSDFPDSNARSNQRDEITMPLFPSLAWHVLEYSVTFSKIQWVNPPSHF